MKNEMRFGDRTEKISVKRSECSKHSNTECTEYSIFSSQYIVKPIYIWSISNLLLLLNWTIQALENVTGYEFLELFFAENSFLKKHFRI